MLTFKDIKVVESFTEYKMVLEESRGKWNKVPTYTHITVTFQTVEVYQYARIHEEDIRALLNISKNSPIEFANNKLYFRRHLCFN